VRGLGLGFEGGRVWAWRWGGGLGCRRGERVGRWRCLAKGLEGGVCRWLVGPRSEAILAWAVPCGIG
jgi:hypothetical protein